MRSHAGYWLSIESQRASVIFSSIVRCACVRRYVSANESHLQCNARRFPSLLLSTSLLVLRNRCRIGTSTESLENRCNAIERAKSRIQNATKREKNEEEEEERTNERTAAAAHNLK